MKFYSSKLLIPTIKLLVLLSVVFSSIRLNAQSKGDMQVNLDKIPPRIIRACCAFGYDLKLWGVPFVKIDQVISIDDLGDHHYMGDKKEGVGTIYTHKGGFIDIGHLRDQIDWTRYLHAVILNYKGKGQVALPLRNEAGRKTLHLNVPADYNDSDCILLAGKIAYDFSLWHEISTWFGASTVPFLKERFSSFSVEDVYSNLLGIHIGMKTIRADLPFNSAATKFIASTLDSLAVVKTAEETYDAYNTIHNEWYTNTKRIPRTSITLKRDTDVLISSRPWIVRNQSGEVNNPIVLEVPLFNAKGELLTKFYQFNIDVNNKIPLKEIFPNRKSGIVNQNDFGILLDRITTDLQSIQQKDN